MKISPQFPVWVGLFTESYEPVVNGVSTSVKTLAGELVEAGHRPVVVAPRFPGYVDAPTGEGKGVPVLRLPSWRTRWNPQNPFAYPPLPSWLGKAPGSLRNASFNIVHTQQPFGMGLHGKAVARRLKVPLVSTFHTLYMEYAHYFPVIPTPIARRFLAFAMTRYYGSCNAVIVPSREAGRRLQILGVSESLLRVVPTGVGEAVFASPEAAQAARKKYDVPPGAPLILFVGRLAREKNLELLFDAFARVLAAGGFPIAPVLVLAGSGPWREECESAAKKSGAEAQIRFAGFVTRENLAPLYTSASLFAFPSPTETQGVVLSEAQSYGVPCVVVEGGGASEFVRANADALVVPPTVDAFTNALADLLHNHAKRDAFAQAARESPLRPTPSGMAQAILDVYDRALRE